MISYLRCLAAALFCALVLFPAIAFAAAAPSPDQIAGYVATATAVALVLGKVLAGLIAAASALTAVTRYPRLAAGATRVQRMLVALLRLCDRLSALTHSDSPDTAQVPFFQISQPPADAPARSSSAGFARFGVMASLAVAAVVAMVGAVYIGCAQDQVIKDTTVGIKGGRALVAGFKTFDHNYKLQLEASLEKGCASTVVGPARDACVACYVVPINEYQARRLPVVASAQLISAAADAIEATASVAGANTSSSFIVYASDLLANAPKVATAISQFESWASAVPPVNLAACLAGTAAPRDAGVTDASARPDMSTSPDLSATAPIADFAVAGPDLPNPTTRDGGSL